MGPEYKKNIDKYDEEILSEGMIANAKILSNDKYEYDNILMLYSDRLKIVPNGKSRISKKIKVNSFNDRYMYRILNWPLNYKGIKDDFRNSIFELSSVTTSLFSYRTNEREYTGLEQVINHGDRIETIGYGLNYMVNTVYTLMASYTKFMSDLATPNDIMYKDMITNMKVEPSLYNINLYAFNLARLLLVASDNIPSTNYNKTILNKKSPINSKTYNQSGEHVVLNDLLYAGKYGKAAYQYSKIFDKYAGYDGAFDDLLRSYDNVFENTIKGKRINIDDIKNIIKNVYLYYGSKYLRMSYNNTLDQKDLDKYKKRVKNAFEDVIKQYNLELNFEDINYIKQCEKEIEYLFTQDKTYYKLNKTKESFEPHEKVPMDADNKAREIKLKYKLEG